MPATAVRTSVAVFVASCAAVLLRLLLAGNPGTNLFVEDGSVFIEDAVNRPMVGLVSSYAGYGHFLPRVLATATAMLPIEWWPWAAVSSSAIVVGILAIAVYWAARRNNVGQRSAALAAVAPVVVPIAGWESLGNWANLQWFLVYAAAWAFVQERPDRAQAFVVGVAAASSLVTLLLAPVAAIHRSRRLAVATAVGVSYHVICALDIGGGSRILERRRSGGLAEVPRAVAGGFASSVRDAGPLAIAAGSALLVGASLVAARTRTGAALLACGALVAIATSWFSGPEARYVALAAALVVAGATISPAPYRRCVLLCFCVLASTQLPAATEYRLLLPSWEAEVEAACRPGGDGIAMAGPGTVWFPVHPCSRA